ncbi:MAG: aminotransferase class IV [Dehalococcoidales bacterium]|nr:aminotransferase class IV [Dehalococcoidales bacterium]
MAEIVFLNGEFIPKQQAKIPVTDYGFLYGYGLFETMRAYNGTIFRLDSHISRIVESAKSLNISVQPDLLYKAITGTIEANSLKNARVRLTVSAGEGSMVPDLNSCTEPTVLVTAAEYHPFSDDIYKAGFRLVTADIRRNSQSPLPTMKTTNYMDCLLARHTAKTAGYDEALLLNETGMVAECSTGNIFMVVNGIIITPGIESGILPGITRFVVIQLANQLGIDILGKSVTPEELIRADEVFIANSIMEIMPVAELDGQMIGDDLPGKVTKQLMQAYGELVMREISG